ncbi:MAG: N-acetyltransferase [Acidobacteria bacterium]|nr:MAG: N-acetyltransferase [Acidobacteriota bacterium]PYR50499.1 MAG: N-acetyltransferase [Acidobacteriota bacterium]
MLTTIRPAHVSDAGAIAALTFQLGYDVEASDLAERLGRIVARTDQRVWIADVEGRPAGWLHAGIAEHVASDAFVEVVGLVVDKQHRQHGVGTALLKQAEQWARRSGHSTVRLQCSSARTASHRFYERRGFTSVKTQLSFAKQLDGAGAEGLRRLAPRVDR